jgi:glycosyltransferase involved in cell wall biosynthesis
MKKVLVITDLFPDKYRPNSEVFVHQQAVELAKGYDVRVIATRFKHDFAIEEESKDNIRITYIYLPFVKHVYLSLFFVYKFYAMPIIKKTISSWMPDFIHVHDYRHVPELILLSDCLKAYSIPRFLTIHNIRTHPIMVKSKYFKWFYGLLLSKGYRGWNHIFTVNERIKGIISSDVKIRAVTNIGNAISTTPVVDSRILDKFQKILDKSSYKIISVGNLKAEKGFDLLVDAIRMLIDKNIPIQAFIIGDGEEKKKLQTQIQCLGLSESVILMGDLSNEIVRNLYPLFDAFVLASYSESFGIVYIEAMYAGIPVIGVSGQGIDGIVKHLENGLLVIPNDVEDLVRNIEYLFDNKEIAEMMAMKGQSLIKNNFTLSQLIDKVVKAYEQ